MHSAEYTEQRELKRTEYSIAVSYPANGETLGSKVCERIKEKADQTDYELYFVPDELPTAPLESFRLDVFAAKKLVRIFRTVEAL